MIKVVTPKHTLFAANHLVNQVAKLGLAAEVREFCDFTDNSLHIIYQASPLYRLPKKYIVMQTEIAGSHWFNRGYLKTLANALAVWDYSELNIPRYERLNKKISIVTPGINPQPAKDKDIPYLFYGWINGSERRERIVNELKQKMDLTIQTNLTGPAMWSLLSRTQTVINVHYYDHSPPELYRIHESISHGCKVYLQDEGRYFDTPEDNLEEIKRGLSVAGL